MNCRDKCIRTLLPISLLVLLVVGVTVGCNSSIIGDDFDRVADTMQKNDVDKGKIDELWLIDTKDALTMDDISKVIEANADYYTTKDGEIDVDLLRNFVLSSFDSVDILTNPDDIEKVLGSTQICCIYDPETKTIRIIIVKENN